LASGDLEHVAEDLGLGYVGERGTEGRESVERDDRHTNAQGASE
jgi:hypothetical protein